MYSVVTDGLLGSASVKSALRVAWRFLMTTVNALGSELANTDLGSLVASLPIDGILLLALVLLVAGVAGSITPMVPGGLLSLAGVYLYWFYGDPSRLGTVALVALTIAGLLVLVVDYLVGAVSARASGASTRTTLAAAAVSFVLFFVTGPFGVLLGTFGTVYGVERYSGQPHDESARRGLVTAGGVLASSVVQLALTLLMLAVFVIIVFL